MYSDGRLAITILFPGFPLSSFSQFAYLLSGSINSAKRFGRQISGLSHVLLQRCPQLCADGRQFLWLFCCEGLRAEISDFSIQLTKRHGQRG
jgi:hypothetical protein